MKHYGLRTKDGDYLHDDSGMIFWTTSIGVARIQLKSAQRLGEYQDLEVVEIIDREDVDRMKEVLKDAWKESCSGTVTYNGPEITSIT